MGAWIGLGLADLDYPEASEDCKESRDNFNGT